MYFDAEAVDQWLPYAGMVEALRSGLLQRASAPLRSAHTVKDDGSTLLVMPAWSNVSVGVKLITIIPGNSARGLPSVQGAYALFDSETGTPRAIVDGTQLTIRRTAALCALATEYLAQGGPQRLLVLGTGSLAPHVIQAHAAMREWSSIALWGRSAETAQRRVDELREAGFDVKRAVELESAVREASVISCATSASRPLLTSDWVQDGAHINLLGGYRADMQEADEAVVARSTLFVDNREAVLAEGGDVIVPLRKGLITPQSIVGDIRDLIASGEISRSPGEITVFKSVGWATLDLVAAEFLADRVKAAQ